jgi:hypothetical protein
MVICKPYGLIDGTNQHSFLLGSFGEVFDDLIFANIYIDHLSTPGGFYGDTVPCQQQMKCYIFGKNPEPFCQELYLGDPTPNN